jgi:hypothetical protein
MMKGLQTLFNIMQQELQTGPTNTKVQILMHYQHKSTNAAALLVQKVQIMTRY